MKSSLKPSPEELKFSLSPVWVFFGVFLVWFCLPASFVTCVNTDAMTFMVKDTKSLLASFLVFSCSSLSGTV